MLMYMGRYLVAALLFLTFGSLTWASADNCPELPLMKTFTLDKTEASFKTYKNEDKSIVLVTNCSEKLEKGAEKRDLEKVLTSLKENGVVTRMNPDEFMLEIKNSEVLARTYYKVDGIDMYQYAFSAKMKDAHKLKSLHVRISKELRSLKK